MFDLKVDDIKTLTLTNGKRYKVKIIDINYSFIQVTFPGGKTGIIHQSEIKEVK